MELPKTNIIQIGNVKYYYTGKVAKDIVTGEATFEYEPICERIWVSIGGTVKDDNGKVIKNFVFVNR